MVLIGHLKFLNYDEFLYAIHMCHNKILPQKVKLLWNTACITRCLQYTPLGIVEV